MTTSSDLRPVAATAPSEVEVSFVLACGGDIAGLVEALTQISAWSTANEDVSMELVLVSRDAHLLAAAVQDLSGAPIRTLHVAAPATAEELLALGTDVAVGRELVSLAIGVNEAVVGAAEAAVPAVSAPVATLPPVAATHRGARGELSTRTDPHAQARAAREQPVLLHSLSLFREVFEVVYAHHTIDTVVEVGVESGQVSSIYTDLGASRVFCVEAFPNDDLRRRLAAHPGLHLVERPSPAALAELPIADLYVIDGDHNYATVRAEVAWILENAPDAVVVLHDVMWPCARRDFYYQPSLVPLSEQHATSPGGPSVWTDQLTPKGFHGAGAYLYADSAGGERNGVLTGIEDALAARPAGWRLEIVPAVFGVAILARETVKNGALFQALKPYTESRLLLAMENNRIALYGRVLEMQYDAAEGAEAARRANAVIAAQHAELEQLRALAGEQKTRLEHQDALLGAISQAIEANRSGSSC